MESVVILNDKIKYDMNNIINIKMNICTQCIVKGTVYFEEGNYYPNAVVQIVEKNLKTNKQRVLGVVTTDENGEYYFPVSPQNYIDYQINVFPMFSEGGEL